MLFLKIANPRSFSMFPTFIPRTAPHIHPLIPRLFSISPTQIPDLLGTSPQNLDANFRALRGIGLSHSALTQIILSAPTALQLSAAAPQIKFWMDFLAGDEASLVKAFKRNRGLLHVRSNIPEKISLLQSHGLSTSDICRILILVPNFITVGVSTIEDMLKRAKELGFQTGSGMFLVALCTAKYPREALKKKMELLMSFGWSETDFYSALRKAPRFVNISEKNLRVKMRFLIEEAGCDPSYIASHPILLPFSLEKRLRPRLRVLQLLESEGLSVKGRGVFPAIQVNDKKEAIFGLHEAYLAACA